jgi:two-component system LytT family response regulator
MKRAIIIDDEPLGRALIEQLLKPFSAYELVGSFHDGFVGFKGIMSLQPDLVFLDVQMPRLSGFEMLELLDRVPPVIFVTAHEQYALRAFDAHALDYLLKPVTKERFAQAMEKTEKLTRDLDPQQIRQASELYNQERYQQRIVVKDANQIRIIPCSDILRLETSDDYVIIYTAGNKVLKNITLSSLEAQLDPSHFVRVHRSYMIPLSQLVSVEAYEKDSHIALLQGGHKVPISKSGMARLKAALKW